MPSLTFDTYYEVWSYRVLRLVVKQLAYGTIEEGRPVRQGNGITTIVIQRCWLVQLQLQLNAWRMMIHGYLGIT